MFTTRGWDSTSVLTPILTADKAAVMVLAILVALVPYRLVTDFTGRRYAFQPAMAAFSMVCAVLAMAMMSVNGFSPFIYFRF